MLSKQYLDFLGTHFAKLNRDNTFGGTIHRTSGGTKNIGAPDAPWDNIYANSVIANVVVGQMTGSEWESTGNMIIDAHSATGETTLYVVNQDGSYQASLDVEKDIILGGTVDGVDLANFNAATFLVTSLSGYMSNERTIAGGDGITGTDGGAGNNYTISVDYSTGLDISSGQLVHATGDSGDLHTNYAEHDGTETITGAWTFDRDPGAPFSVSASSAVVTNLDSDKLDGYEASELAVLAESETITGLWTFDRDPNPPFAVSASSAAVANLDADKLDGYEGSQLAVLAENETITGAWTYQNNIAFSGARQITGDNNITLAPSGDLYLNPGGDDVLPSTGNINLGAVEDKFLTVHASELWVDTLVAQSVVATIGGRVVVAPTSYLTQDLTNVATTIYLKHNSFASGERIYLEKNGKIEWIALTSGPTAGTGEYSYTISRDLDGTGANAWDEGDAVVNTGTTGDGIIELYSLWGMLGLPFAHVFNYDSSETHYSSNYNGTATWTIWESAGEAGDILYLGFDSKFYAAYWFLTTPGAFDFEYEWQYSTAAGWSPLTTFITTAPNFESPGLQSLVFTEPTGTAWATRSVNGSTEYWIRAYIDTWNTGYTTLPVNGGRNVRRGENQVGPTIVGNIRTGTEWYQITEGWAIGNMNGLYGYSDDTYGIGLGVTTSNHMTIDSTDGIRFFDGSGNQRAQLSGSEWIIGADPTGSNSNVYINAGALYLRQGETNIITLPSSGDATIASTLAITGSGKLKIGTDDVVIDANGISFEVPSSYTALTAVKWEYPGIGDTTLGNIHTAFDGSLAAPQTNMTINVRGYNSTDPSSGLLLQAQDWDNSPLVSIELISAKSGWSSGVIEITGVINSSSPIITSSITRVGHSLVVGSTTETPAYSDCIEIWGTTSNVYDPRIAFFPYDNTSNEWSIGVDDSDGDRFKICFSEFLNGNDFFEIDTSGNWYKGGHATDGHIFVPLSSPITHSSFDGDTYGDVSTSQEIAWGDWDSPFVPSTAKALLIQIICDDYDALGGSGALADGLYVSVGPTSTYWYTLAARPQNNGVSVEAQGVVATDPSNAGSIWYQINATGANRMTVYIRCWGYWI